MKLRRRLRARARTRLARRAGLKVRHPRGIAYSAILIIAAMVPAANAAVAGQPGPTGATGEPSVPVVAQSGRPVVSGRITDRHATGRDGIDVRARVSGASKALLTLRARRTGTRRWLTVRRRQANGPSVVTLTWRDPRPGRYVLRVIATAGDHSSTDSLGAAFSYRRSFASWYGPGFYGGRTACGQTLTSTIVGVANKSLPCGTRVTFRLHGHTVTARVIDRGPFTAGRQWDLTPALKRKLRFGSTGHVHATS